MVSEEISGRFWAKVDRRGPDECWPYTDAIGNHGYGVFHPAKPLTVLAHRFAYELANGDVPDGLHVDHTCHNNTDCPGGKCEHRMCCNPAHFEAVPQKINVNRSHKSNIRKTHCPKGHEYTPKNTRLQSRGNTTSRSCLECARERDRQPHRNAAVRRRRYAQQKAA